MFSLRRILRGPEHSVQSLAVQAEAPAIHQESTVFEVLTQHLLNRLVHNEALGEEIPTRIAQLAYMFALPGVLMALYLSAPYHQLPPLGPRPFWLQISDHYVYTMYAFVTMGVVTVFEWDLLFPDLLDVFVLTTLPLSRRRLLLSRILSLTIFHTLILFGTNILGTLFFPAVADLHGMWLRHILAHSVAIAMAGTFAAAFFVALQGGLLCLLGRKFFAWVSPCIQAISMIVLLTILFLTPLLGTHLSALLTSRSSPVLYFPPFWFLGLYECLLWRTAVMPVFIPLAKLALFATLGVLALVVLTYPLAYERRTRQLVEGSDSTHRSSPINKVFQPLLHALLLRSPQQRAIYHFISQTVFRTSRLRLYLTIYAGVGISLAISGVLLLRIHQGDLHVGVSVWGIRAVVPVLVFLIPIGLRTALRAPIGTRGSWIFYVIHGKPLHEHLQAIHQWVTLYVAFVAFASSALVLWITPESLWNSSHMLAQILVSIALPILLTEFFFLHFHDLPFTTTRTPTTVDLPISFVRYAVIFPFFVLYVTTYEIWMEARASHLVGTVFLFIVLYIALNRLHSFYRRRYEEDPAPADTGLGHRLGLQE